MNPLEHAVDIELDFICDTCGRPVEDDEGALYVLHGDIVDRRSAMEDWERTRDPNGLTDLPTLLMMPGLAPWRIQHDTCGAISVDGYDIGVEKVRTWRALLGWTSQLMEKTWLPVTNWAVVIGDAAEGRSARIAAHARDDAA